MKKKQLTLKEVKQEALCWLTGQHESADDSRHDLDIIVDDYIKCIKYLLKGKLVPIIGFRNGVYEWLMTDSDGDINLDAIPHDDCELTECRYEIGALIDDNGYDTDIILKALHERIHVLLQVQISIYHSKNIKI